MGPQDGAVSALS